MSLIATHTLDDTGAAPTFAAAAASDTATISTRHFLVVRNASDAAITVTIAVPGDQVAGAANDDVAISIDAAADSVPGEAWIPMSWFYADPTDGTAHISWSTTTDVTRALVKR